MIKATELRIGNYFNYGKAYENRYSSPCQITWMALDDTSDFDPIPITEEYLLRFGFVAYDGVFGVGYKITMEIEPSHILGESSRELTVSPDAEKYFLDGNYLMRLKYIHQLQNLYFALTGKELTLKTT